MNIRIPYIMNPIREGKYSITTVTKNSKTKKEAIIRYRAIVYSPKIIATKEDIFG